MAFQSVFYLFTHTVKKKKKKQILKCVIVYIVLAGLQTHWLSLADGLQSLVSDTLPPTPCPKMGGLVYYCLAPRVTP